MSELTAERAKAVARIAPGSRGPTTIRTSSTYPDRVERCEGAARTVSDLLRQLRLALVDPHPLAADARLSALRGLRGGGRGARLARRRAATGRGELAYLNQRASTRGFERPFGRVWLLMLQAELEAHGTDEGRHPPSRRAGVRDVSWLAGDLPDTCRDEYKLRLRSRAGERQLRRSSVAPTPLGLQNPAL